MWKRWNAGRRLDVIKRYAIGKPSFLFSVSRPRWETRAVFYCRSLFLSHRKTG
nr:MAG TPA: hypothetical protein [Caudoviricetes sp.]